MSETAAVAVAVTQRGQRRDGKQKRERGTGGLIRKPGSQYWYALFYEGGRQRCVSTRETSETRARGILANLVGKSAAGLLPAIGSEKLVYDDIRKGLLDDYRISGNKSYVVKKDGTEDTTMGLGHLDSFFGGMKVNRI